MEGNFHCPLSTVIIEFSRYRYIPLPCNTPAIGNPPTSCERKHIIMHAAGLVDCISSCLEQGSHSQLTRFFEFHSRINNYMYYLYNIIVYIRRLKWDLLFSQPAAILLLLLSGCYHHLGNTNNNNISIHSLLLSTYPLSRKHILKLSP